MAEPQQTQRKRRLNQVLAIEIGTRPRIMKELTAQFQTLQKPALFSGEKKIYQKLEAEDRDDQPPVNHLVQSSVPEILDEVKGKLVELYNVVGTKDYANCHALADVMVGDQLLIKQAPAPFLLWLEKMLAEHIQPLLDSIPTLDPAEDWNFDENISQYKSAEIKTARTKKITAPLVLLQPTKEHPGQAKETTTDVTAGYWNSTRFSTAIKVSQKKELVTRLKELQRAIKEAREHANMVEAQEVKSGDQVFTWLFGK